MIRCATPFLSALLALGLAISAFAQGHDQVKASAYQVHELVICDETEFETIFVDGAGELFDPDACTDGLCQDCLRVAVALSPSIVATRLHEFASVLTVSRRAPVESPPTTRMGHQPRAPTLLKQA